MHWPAMNGEAYLRTTIALATAFLLGGVIGFERQWRQRTAGLRTNVLVAVGAAAFVDLGARLTGPDGGMRVVAYVVSGIGFLGAGVIMREGAQIRGINTAATLWASGAVGAFAGAGLPLEAALVAVFVLSGNTLLRPVVAYIDRRPIRAGETEAYYRIHITCLAEQQDRARDVLLRELAAHHLPLREIERMPGAEGRVEFAAVLATASADEEELMTIIEHLQSAEPILAATRTVSTEN
jgi:putative Mg2+ transporter-C (MgtC) family protein